MSEFFSGWRRKVGCMTLLLSCAFVGAWVRSQSSGDNVNFKNIQLLSYKGGVFCERLTGQTAVDMKFAYGSGDNFQDLYRSPKWNKKWRWRGIGFAYGDEDVKFAATNGNMITGKMIYYVVPYWAITMPLTLVSAFLLLTKQRPALAESFIESKFAKPV